MTGSRPRLRFAFRATMAALAILLLARCSDNTVHGSAGANGSDRSSVGQVRLGFPF